MRAFRLHIQFRINDISFLHQRQTWKYDFNISMSSWSKTFTNVVAPKRAVGCLWEIVLLNHLLDLLLYFVTAFVPSLTACLASSPGRSSLTAVWISRELIVFFLAYFVNWDAPVAIRSKMSLTNEFMMSMALPLIPASGWTCFNTL